VLTPVFPGSVFNSNRHKFFSKSEYLTTVTALQALFEPAVSIAIDEYIAAATITRFQFPI
jgi:hypothetical protein